MPIDPRIALMGQGPQIESYLDKSNKAMTVRRLSMLNDADQRALDEQSAIKNAYRSSVTADGQTLDRKALMSELHKINPLKAIEVRKDFAATDRAEAEARLKQLTEQAQIKKELAWSIYDQNSYSAARQKGIELGLPNANSLPPQYDPKLVKQMQISTLAGTEQLAEQWKQMNFDYTKSKDKQTFDYTKQKDKRDYLAGRADKAKEFGFREQDLTLKKEEISTKKAAEAGKIATELRKERSGLPVTRATQDMSAAYNKMQTAVQKPSAAGDMSLIFGYMKMLDPGSTVREGEQATATNARGVPDSILNLYESLRTGKRLTPEQRADFMNRAGGLYKGQIDLQKQVDAQFSEYAKKAGADPNEVIVNFEANMPLSKEQLNSMNDADIDKIYSEMGGQ